MLRAAAISCTKSPGAAHPSIALAPTFAIAPHAMIARTGVAVANPNPRRKAVRGSRAAAHTTSATHSIHQVGLISVDTRGSRSGPQPLPGARHPAGRGEGPPEEPPA